MVADLAGCVEHLPTDAPTLSARLHVHAVLGPWALIASPNPQKKTGEVMEAEPRTPRGVLAKIARILGAVQPQLSFRKTPEELIELIGDKVDADLASIKGDQAALLEVLADVVAEHGDGDGAAEAPAATSKKEPVREEPAARGRGRGGAPAKDEPKEPARGRGGAKKDEPKEPVRGRGRGRVVEEEPEEEEEEQTPEPEEAPRGRGGRGRGGDSVKEPVEEAPRGRGRGRSAPAESEPEPAAEGRRGRGRARGEPEAAESTAPVFDASALEADIAALKLALEGKAEAKALVSIEKNVALLVAHQDVLDKALALVINELFFTDNKSGKLTKDALKSVLEIEDIEAYVFPE